MRNKLSLKKHTYSPSTQGSRGRGSLWVPCELHSESRSQKKKKEEKKRKNQIYFHSIVRGFRYKGLQKKRTNFWMLKFYTQNNNIWNYTLKIVLQLKYIFRVLQKKWTMSPGFQLQTDVWLSLGQWGVSRVCGHLHETTLLWRLVLPASCSA